jgi:hypothetical protein
MTIITSRLKIISERFFMTRAILCLLFLPFSLAGCKSFQNELSNDQPTKFRPTNSQTARISKRLLASSLAQPCERNEIARLSPDQTSNIWIEVQSVLNILPLNKVLNPDENITDRREGSQVLPNSKGISFKYTISEDLGQAPVLIAGIGTADTSLESFAIITYDYDSKKWRYQPYPQAKEEIAIKRQNLLSGSAFCGARLIYTMGNIRRLNTRVQGNLMAVSIDLGVGTMIAQEVHLLSKKNGIWEAVWAPVYDDIEHIRGVQVQFRDNMDFNVAKVAEIPGLISPNPYPKFWESWKLEGGTYVKASTGLLPP